MPHPAPGRQTKLIRNPHAITAPGILPQPLHIPEALLLIMAVHPDLRPGHLVLAAGTDRCPDLY